MKLISKVIKRVEGEKKVQGLENNISFKPKKKKGIAYVLLFTGIFSLIGGGGYYLWSNVLNDSYSPIPKPRRNLSERLKEARGKPPIINLDTTTTPKEDSSSMSLAGKSLDSLCISNPGYMDKVQVEKEKSKKEKISAQSSFVRTISKEDSTVLLPSQKKEDKLKNSKLSSFPEDIGEEKVKPSIEKQNLQKIDKSYQTEKSVAKSPVLNNAKNLPGIKSSEREKLVLNTPLSEENSKSPNQLSLTEKKQLVNNYFDFGLKSQNSGKLKEAEECYLKAIELNPNFYPARLNLSSIYLEENRIAEAEKELNYLLNQKKEEPKILYNLALVSYIKEEYKNAEEYLNGLLLVNPDNSKAYLLSGKIFESQKEYNEAIKAYLKAYQINPGDPQIIYSLGRVKDLCGEKREALTYYSLFLKNSIKESSELRQSVRDRVIFLSSGGKDD
ncbi:MAG: tetratricopeptide repeat protein [candidate division Zixibacteria bacterium]|nr:tetratricopeptide repeat protein [candidate division Zixibacteria bacterium]